MYKDTPKRRRERFDPEPAHHKSTKLRRVESDDATTDSSEDNPESPNDHLNLNEIIQLSNTVLLYPNRKLGNQGNVFEGEFGSRVLKRPCAIKFDHATNEGHILNRLGFHDRIVSVLESGFFLNDVLPTIFIALEKCHEDDLYQVITSQRLTNDVTTGIEYCKQLLDGMIYIHENLIIHKDLKPSNILLTQNFTNLKIADFGISQALNSKHSMVSCQNYGTRGYRPPESFLNSIASLKSDTFSLGCLFYFILSNGMSPFGQFDDLWDHNIFEGVIDLSQLLVPNPTTTRHLIKMMLSTDRRRRPFMQQVEEHPSWDGEEHECNFDYGFRNEVVDHGRPPSPHPSMPEEPEDNPTPIEPPNLVVARSVSPEDRCNTEELQASRRGESTVNSELTLSDSDDSDNEQFNENAVILITDTAIIFPHRRLGQQGNVFEGELGTFVYRRPCAIKFAPDTNEGDILNKLGFHDHIIVLFESGYHASQSTNTLGFGPIYLAVEKCDNDLHNHMINQGDQCDVERVEERKNYCRQLLSGMKYVHENFIIHKDLKPANILLTRDSTNIKIADFGISQKLSSPNSMVRCHNFGTNGYRPPESLLDSNSVASLKSDTFSLGVVFYFLLSFGNSPFGQHPELWNHNSLNSNINLSQLCVPNPATTEHLIKLMLSKDRLRRPTIQQVEQHPFWDGKEHPCNFDYGIQKEFLEVNAAPVQGEIENPNVAVTEEEMAAMDRQWARALKEWRPPVNPNSQPSRNEDPNNAPDAAEIRRQESAEWLRLTGTIRYCMRPLHGGRKVHPAIQKGRKHEIERVVKLIQSNPKREREIDNLMQLDEHINIVRFVDWGTLNEHQLFLVMERCLQNLAEYITENDFVLHKASTFFKQTMSAVNYIHSKNIVHRDLKPGHILITKDKNSIKVSNFGISREISEEGSLTDVSDPGPDQAPLTYSNPETGFSAPETYRGKTGYKSDIFSLAINGYYMITHGLHPFGEIPQQRPPNIVNNTNRDLSSIPQFPDPYVRKNMELNELFQQMLHPTPRERPPASRVLNHEFFDGLPERF